MNTLKVEIIIPNWANWITVDRNGECWAWKKKPVRDVDCWNDRAFLGNGRRLYMGAPQTKWKDELYTWS